MAGLRGTTPDASGIVDTQADATTGGLDGPAYQNAVHVE
jgi:hypothetical protein